MTHRLDDKFVQEVYYKPEGGQNPAFSSDHINPLVRAEEPLLHSSYSLTKGQTSTTSKPFVRTSPARIPPRRIALCGGGMKCVAHVGVMKAFKKANMLHCLKEMIGISGGAFFCLLYVLGYTLDEIERLSIEFDFSVLRTIEPDSKFMFPITFGLDPGNSIERLIHSVLRQKGFGPDTTFRDLADHYPIGLRCYATELQTSKVREFSVKASPHTKIVFAIHASMALPVLYTPVKDPDSPILLVDGGILHNLPLVFLNQQETAETIGILFTGGEDEGQSESQEPTIIDICRYIYNTVNVMRTLPYIEKYKENLITINLGSQTAFNFEETPASRAGLIEAAMKQANTFIYGFRFSRPARRFSAC